MTVVVMVMVKRADALVRTGVSGCRRAGGEKSRGGREGGEREKDGEAEGEDEDAAWLRQRRTVDWKSNSLGERW